MADALGLQRCVSGTQLRDDFGHGLAADVLRSGGKAQIGGGLAAQQCARGNALRDRKSTRLNSSHLVISYAVFCLKKKKEKRPPPSLQSTSARQRPSVS